MVVSPLADVSVAVGKSHGAIISVHFVVAKGSFVGSIIFVDQFTATVSGVVDELTCVRGAVRISECAGAVFTIAAKALGLGFGDKKQDRQSRKEEADNQIITNLHE